MRCHYVVCDGEAFTKARMTALDGDHARRIEVGICKFHDLALTRWFKDGYVPHVTPGGAIYVGDLDELCRHATA